MRIFEALEILDRSDGRPSGRYRLTSRTDREDGIPPRGLCDHEHDSPEDARRCPTARAQLPTYLLEDQGDRCDKCGQTIK